MVPRAISVFVVAGWTLAIAGCSEDQGFEPPASDQPRVCVYGWCWESPYPHGALNRAVWGSSSADVWVVGEGPAMRFDGKAWTGVEVPDIGARNGVWGSGPDDVWIVGSTATARFDGSTWTRFDDVSGADIHGSGPTDVWLTGLDGGTHWDGTQWATEVPVAAGIAIWVDGPNDVWVAGQSTIRRWNGTEWTVSLAPDELTTTFTDVFSVGGGQAWALGGALGDDRAVYRFDGSSWTLEGPPLGDNEEPTAGWGSGPNDVWIGTTSGMVHFDGSGWSVGAPVIADDPIQGLLDQFFAPIVSFWGFGAGDAWAVGDYGQVIRVREDGLHVQTQWLPFNDGAAWVDTDDRLWTAGWGYFHEAGTLSDDAIYFEEDGEVLALWGDSRNVLWGVGGNGLVVRKDGDTVEAIRSGTAGDLVDVWGTGPNDVWAVGGDIVHFDGEQFLPVTSEAFEDAGQIVAVDGTGSNDVFVATSRGGVFRWDGTTWEPLGGGADIEDLSVVSADCAWAITDHALRRWQRCDASVSPDECWSLDLSSTNDLSAILASSCDSAVAVGSEGAIVETNGLTVNELAGEITSKDLHTILERPDGSLFVVGVEGTILSSQP